MADGARVVSLLNWDAATNNRELRLARDFVTWRELTSVENLGLSRTVDRNLIVDGRQPEVVTVAETSASAFSVARVVPALGRYLLPDDERPAAPEAIVIGHAEWVRRFGSDPGIVGRALQLGRTTYTVVGVMPEGFAFPINHSFWIPWRLDASAFEPRSGPVVNVFGRLAPGATLEAAQAELTTLGKHMAATSPATHSQLRPRVLPYAYAFSDMDDPENAIALHAIQLALVLLARRGVCQRRDSRVRSGQ